MPNFNHAINTFSAGEFSPRAQSRSDTQQYQQGAAEITNFVAGLNGCEKRMGTLLLDLDGSVAADDTLLAAMFDGTKYFRMIPYLSSNGARDIVFVASISGVSTNTFIGYATLSNNTFFSTNRSSLITGYSSSRSITQAQIDAMNWVQVGDILFFQIPGHPTLTYRHDGYDVITMSMLESTTLPNTPTVFSAAGSWERFAFLPRNVLNSMGRGTLTPSADSGSVTMTSSAGIFVDGHVGARFKFNSGTVTYRATCTAVTNTTTATFTISDTFDATTAFGNSSTRSWEEQAYSDAQGWPTCVAYHQERILVGDTTGTVRGTQQGNLNYWMNRRFEQDPDFADAVSNDLPFSFQIADELSSKVRWMKSGKSLLLGTGETEFSVTSKAGAIGPVNLPEISPDSRYGGEAVQATRLENAVYYVGASGKLVRELTFNFDEDSYKAMNLNTLADNFHVKRAAADLNKNLLRYTRLVADRDLGVLWALTGDGGVHSCAINRTAGTAGWSSHVFGGTSNNTSDSGPYAYDMIALPDANGNVQMFFAVIREIDGSTVTNIEYMSVRFDGDNIVGTGLPYPVYLDASVLYTAGPYTTLTGLDHLEGEEVAVVADGKYIGDYTVSSGSIALGGSYGSTYAVAGLKFTARIKTLDLDAGSNIGSAQGLSKKATKATVRLYNAYGLTLGVNDNTEREPVLFRTPADGAESVDLYTGDKEVYLPMGYDKKCQIILETSDPFPCTIAGLFVQGKANV